MTFKEFKKQNNLKDFWLSFDWDIYCDIAEKAGYDPMNERMYNHYGDHPTYNVRKLSREFSISKSQVNRDLHNLRFIDDELYISCTHILKSHIK